MKPEDFLWAIVLRPWPDEPVFHCIMHAGDKVFPNYTQCGRRISPYTPLLPRKHAVKFARPCKDCFR